MPYVSRIHFFLYTTPELIITLPLKMSHIPGVLYLFFSNNPPSLYLLSRACAFIYTYSRFTRAYFILLICLIYGCFPHSAIHLKPSFPDNLCRSFVWRERSTHAYHRGCESKRWFRQDDCHGQPGSDIGQVRAKGSADRPRPPIFSDPVA